MTRIPRGYAVVRGLTRFLLALFYERIEVVGKERVPESGGLIVAANHHNSIVDAMLLIAALDRPLRVLANAPLFRHPLIGPFLRLMGGLPVHRRKEAGDDPQKNAALFAATTAALRAGEAIAIFPEGRTQPEPALQEVRTGTARMLLAAEEGKAAAVALLPVGLVFDEPGTFRSGRALVLIGPPVSTEGIEGGDSASARALTARLAEALRGQIVEADDRRTLRLLHLVEELWRGDGAARPDTAERVRWLQGAMRAYRELKKREPERVAAVRGELEAFDSDVERAGLAADRLSRRYSAATVLRFAATQAVALLISAPLALCGLLVHGIPYRLTALAVRWIPHTDEEEAADKIAAGLVLYPIGWAVEAWLAHRLGGRTGLTLFLIALPATGFFALAWSERFDHVRGEARAFFRFLADRGLPRRLAERRRRLAAELHELARLSGAFTEGDLS